MLRRLRMLCLPAKAGIRMAAERGVVTVINVISEPESKSQIPFDEKALVEELGIQNVFIPVTPKSFSADVVDRFAKALDEASGGGVLVHCASSNRAGGIWAAYLV